MSYQKGQLIHFTPERNDECYSSGAYACDECGGHHDAELPEGGCGLPHSCDEWIIGTQADAENLIADIRAAFNLK